MQSAHRRGRYRKAAPDKTTLGAASCNHCFTIVTTCMIGHWWRIIEPGVFWLSGRIRTSKRGIK